MQVSVVLGFGTLALNVFGYHLISHIAAAAHEISGWSRSGGTPLGSRSHRQPPARHRTLALRRRRASPRPGSGCKHLTAQADPRAGHSAIPFGVECAPAPTDNRAVAADRGQVHCGLVPVARRAGPRRTDAGSESARLLRDAAVREHYRRASAAGSARINVEGPRVVLSEVAPGDPRPMGRNPRPYGRVSVLSELRLRRYKTCSIRRASSGVSWSKAAGWVRKASDWIGSPTKCGSCATIYLCKPWRSTGAIQGARPSVINRRGTCRWR